MYLACIIEAAEPGRSLERCVAGQPRTTTEYRVALSVFLRRWPAGWLWIPFARRHHFCSPVLKFLLITNVRRALYELQYSILNTQYRYSAGPGIYATRRNGRSARTGRSCSTGRWQSLSVWRWPKFRFGDCDVVIEPDRSLWRTPTPSVLVSNVLGLTVITVHLHHWTYA